jgi:hypothetical protein
MSAGCVKRQVRIDREMRHSIDTLASMEINALRPLLDSLCLQKTDSLVASLRDSVMMARREEMRKLLGK